MTHLPSEGFQPSSSSHSASGFRRSVRAFIFLMAFVAGVLGFLTGSPVLGATLSLAKDGVVIEQPGGVTVTMAYPVLVDAAKVKGKVAESSVSGNRATLKYEGGGTMLVEVGAGEVTFKPSGAPEGTKFIHTLMRINAAAVTGGKWKLEAKDGEFPAQAGAGGALGQGNGNRFDFQGASGGPTVLLLPDNTFEQLQDGRQWKGDYFLWQGYLNYSAGTERYVIQIGDATLPKAAKSTPAPTSAAAEPANESGTQVLKWKDGKKAVFLMAFDDGAPSDLLTVIPELEKRKMVGTFYLVTGNSLYANLRTKWERVAKSPSVVFANHTFTHKGVNNAEELDQELAKNNEVLYRFFPERKQPRLLAYGQPGGVPWKVTKEEVAAALAKHHLVDRPPFQGPPMHYKSAAEMIGVLDKALTKGEMGHLDFHGVGADWLVTPIEWFTEFLDKLDEKREQVWIADAASYMEYLTERQTAVVKVLANGKDGIRIELTCAADPALYDFPLTLSTKVPTDWKAAVVTQGTSKVEVPVTAGTVQYAAVPSGGEIALRPGAGK